MALAGNVVDSLVSSSALKKQTRRFRKIRLAQQRCKRPQMLASGNDGSGGLSYKGAGVDIDAGNELVKRIAKMCPDVGGFGGLFPFGEDSYLVAGTDGVGTKLKLAFDMDKHDTIGQDLVAMSVNDIITTGATPLFFLDYFATSRLDVDVAEKVVSGIVDACKESGMALLGGETAEMPDIYSAGEYDLAGFAVGSVTKDKLISQDAINVGDKLIGFLSSGVHSNGFSLVRKCLAEKGVSLSDKFERSTVGEVLIAPTALYPEALKAIRKKAEVHGASHITGGGLVENVPRMLPKHCKAEITKGSWNCPPIFQYLQELGNVAEAEMYRTFNMGIGFVVAIPEHAVNDVLSVAPPGTCVIGEVVPNDTPKTDVADRCALL